MSQVTHWIERTDRDEAWIAGGRLPLWPNARRRCADFDRQEIAK